MLTNSQNSDMAYYINLAMREQQDTFASALDTYHDRKVAWQVAAEVAYILYNDCLPEWACFIEAFEIIDGSYLFIHRDRRVN